MIISEALRKIRWDLRLSQGELANILESAQTVVSGWENGKTYPGYKTFMKIQKLARDNKLDIDFYHELQD
jgi:predicted transcriptional regulator